jgi:L-fuconolactonase
MPIVDSHCHAALSWYEPIESLLFQMERCGVEQAVLIQIKGQFDNDYQFECLRRYPSRFASVVIVDTHRSDASEHLARLADQGASGVRFQADTRSPGEDPLAIWRTAARLGLPVSCGGTAPLFASDQFAELLAAITQIPIVLEHLGSVNQPTEAQVEQFERILALSRFPNAYLKLPGLGEFCRRAMPVTEPFPFEQPIPPLLERVYQAFGSSRLMWGSDYPPVSAREGYHAALRWPLEQLGSKSQQDREQIFGGTARAVFELPA